MYSDDGDVEDSNRETSEDSDYDPSKDTDDGKSAAEDNTEIDTPEPEDTEDIHNNKQIENTNEGVHETEVHGDPGVDTDHNPNPKKISIDEPGVDQEWTTTTTTDPHPS